MTDIPEDVLETARKILPGNSTIELIVFDLPVLHNRIARAILADRAAQAERMARLEEALGDLVSWFPDEPSKPEWRIAAGEYGADDAISAARRALSQEGSEPS